MKQNRWWFRAVSASLVPLHILTAIPVSASSAVEDKPSLGEAPPAKVEVNRTVPKVAPVRLEPSFSAEPSDQEIFWARIFEEPLVPVGRETTLLENRALVQALIAYVGRGDEGVSALEAFLSRYPSSPWRASLLTNLGLVYQHSGRFTKALAAWEEAWALSKGATEEQSSAVADRAVSELLTFHGRFAREEALRSLLTEVRGRALQGSAAQKRVNAETALGFLEERPNGMFRCGPVAIEKILSFGRPDYRRDPRILACPVTKDGTSLVQLRDLAVNSGRGLQMAKSGGGATSIPVPAVVHWRLRHYSALVEKKDGRYLVLDPTLGDFWIAAAALEEEASGYYLIPEGPLPLGWGSVGKEEGSRVFGLAPPNCLMWPTDPARYTCRDPQVGPGKCGGSGGMAQYSIHTLLVNLHIEDTPVGYTPPVGPPVEFRVSYNDVEVFQPQTFLYANLGHWWTFDWLAYVNDDPTLPNVTVYVPGGGQDTFTGSAPNHEDQSVLVKVSASQYERHFRDGSVQVFAQPERLGTPRKIFMTEWRDPQGNALTFTWDSSLRLVAATDALGQVTTVSYNDPTDPLKITSVTDPFGRTATFQYTATKLSAIIDVGGLTSSFVYPTGILGLGIPYSIQAMTTPYGTTRFAKWHATPGSFVVGKIGERRLDVTDPLGGRERVEHGDNGPVGVEPVVPTGMATINSNLSNVNSYYWDKKAMADAPGDYAKAKVYHWILAPNGLVGSTIESEKAPLENRVWYNYPGQPAADQLGTMRWPSAIGRVLDDGSSQVWKYDYNSRGYVTKAVDPLGRETVYEYDTNEIDLLRIKQKNPASASGYDLLASYTYNSQHLPLTATDASGRTTNFTYNARGQVQTVTNAKPETWTAVYDPNGYLQTISGPLSTTIGLTWDGYGRPRTITNADNYTITLDYDAFDRPTKVSYPDSTYEQVVWDRLHVSRYRDLLGRWTDVIVDALKRPTAIRDPLGRLTTLGWCNCGSLEKLIDARGQTTSWDRDLQSRITKETRADNTTTQYLYETTTSRLKQLTDAKAQVRSYDYFLDNRLKQVSYSNSSVATPAVSFSYDPDYGRLATRTDGTGTTSYAYNAVTVQPALGAARLASIDGPLANDLVSYGYDELGRVQSRSVNGTATSVIYDALSRVTNVTNALGAFVYGYDGNTTRLASVTGPNGLRRLYSYFDQTGDRRLKEIRNEFGANLVSKFNYTYDAQGNIAAWTQQAGTAPAQTYQFGYDSADQLVSATLMSTGASPTVLNSYSYAYDTAGNRTSEQVDSVVTAASHNSVNELKSIQGGGSLRFAGTTDEPATVTVQAKPAQTGSGNTFDGSASVSTGTTTVTVAATDPSGNTATQNYQVTVSGGSGTLSYDSNGNLTADGTRAYEWDARDRLTAVNQGTKRSEFTYDGYGRRVRIVEKDNGSVVSDKRLLWVGGRIAEERDATGGTPTKRYFGQGVQDVGTNLFYAKDHLGSTRELLDNTGVVRARYDYDPYGRRTKAAGDLDADFGFTGHFTHAPTGLTIALYRGYDSNLGRWLSRDPIGLAGGINRYGYVGNNPVNYIDPLGLDWTSFASGFATGLAWGIGLGLIAGMAGGLVAAAIAAYGLYSLASGLYEMATNKCLTEDEIHEMLGGMAGGLVGGIGGAKFGGSAAAKFSGNRGSALPEDGIVYKRTNPKTGEEYVGQAESPERFDARQGEHNRDHGVEHDFEVLERAEPGEGLDVLEEQMIRESGGIQKEGGKLANKRHQMCERRYRAAGGR